MLKLSAVLKTIPFLFTEADGETVELVISEYSVADVNKLVELQKPLVEDAKMPVIEQANMIVYSRIVCAIKQADTNEHYWQDIEALTGGSYPNGLISALYEKVNELNPMNLSGETLDEKKSDS